MRKFKIVIAENDEDEQFFMQEGFNATGLFEIMGQVRNGDALLEWLDEHKTALPEVILSDLNMPGKNGYDVIENVKASPAFAHIPVIITSTSSTQSIIDKCLAKGAAAYLVKPDTFIDYAPYAASMHRLIGEKQLVS